MKFSLEKKIIFFFFLAAIALVSVLVIFYYNTQKIKSTSDLVEHTQEVLRKSDAVLMDVLNIETGSRGYILMGNEIYLQPFNNAVITINSNIEKLALLTKDNPNQQSRIDSLKKVIEERLSFTKNSIEARKQKGLTDSEKTMADGKGKNLTDKIRSLITDINSEELRLLRQRKQTAEKDTQNFALIFLVLFAIILVILITVYIIITSNLRVRKKAEYELRQLNKELVFQNEEKEKRATELITANSEIKTAEEHLKAVNKELEAFSYSVSHDLRAPLRAVHGFTQILKEDYGTQLDMEGNRMMNNIMNNAKKMGQLIDDLLTYSRLGRKELVKNTIRMQDMVTNLCDEIKKEYTDRIIEFQINTLQPAHGDSVAIKQVWVNLISNAVKFSKLKQKAIIEIGSEVKGDEIIYFIKDNGAGFDMRYTNKLFGVFQRLHSNEEFEGTGVGLAIVQRIIAKHGGRVWAEGKTNEGATFYFTLTKS